MADSEAGDELSDADLLSYEQCEWKHVESGTDRQGCVDSKPILLLNLLRRVSRLGHRLRFSIQPEVTKTWWLPKQCLWSHRNRPVMGILWQTPSV